MGYYTPEVLPFAYSLARTFTLANRWFCSVPGPTYPNRRFLLAGTAYGGIHRSRDAARPAAAQRHDLRPAVDAHDINWRNYFTDVPQTAVIPSIIEKHPRTSPRSRKFFHDCAAGHAARGELRRSGARRGLRHRRGARLAAAPVASCSRSWRATSRRHRRDRGGPAGHVLGEDWASPGRRGGAAVAAVAAHPADLHLRRARRLLRPRPAAGRDPARRHPAAARRRATRPAATTCTGPRVPAVVVSPVRAGRRR